MQQNEWWQEFQQILVAINEKLNAVVWGTPMLVLILTTGIYFTVRTGFFQIVKAKFIHNETFAAIFQKKHVRKSKDKSAISQFQALSTALAATLGTGNIAGVAAAISVGGAGAVFWMWVSALFGMMTAFAENVLGIYFRRKNSKGEWTGGAMYYLQYGLKQKKGLRHFSKPLAVLFALFCVLASFGIGNMTQVNSIATMLDSSFSIPPILTGAVLAVVCGMVIIGGIRRIGKFTEKFVPLMATVYILGTVLILILNCRAIPAVFQQIFESAFGFDAISGGISGTLLKQALTMGFKRGVFSNEAGLGSSVMVNSVSDVKEPVVQGMWGIFEVFFDTIVMCTLTAFAILSTGVLQTSSAEGAALVGEAFSHGFGAFAGHFIAIAMLFFAFSTVLGWSFYGEKCMEYLFGSKSTIFYKIVFVPFILVGCTMELNLVWDIADTLNGLMALPNLIGVLALSGTVFRITKNYRVRKLQKIPKHVPPLLSAYTEIQAEQLAKLEAEHDVTRTN